MIGWQNFQWQWFNTSTITHQITPQLVWCSTQMVNPNVSLENLFDSRRCGCQIVVVEIRCYVLGKSSIKEPRCLKWPKNSRSVRNCWSRGVGTFLGMSRVRSTRKKNCCRRWKKQQWKKAVMRISYSWEENLMSYLRMRTRCGGNGLEHSGWPKVIRIWNTFMKWQLRKKEGIYQRD